MNSTNTSKDVKKCPIVSGIQLLFIVKEETKLYDIFFVSLW
jgi:hypothetical protein